MLAAGAVLLGRYRILALLGQGGMGAVYRGWDTRLNLAIAVKELVAFPNTDPNRLAQLRRQFQQEAVVLAHLSHPNLVRVTDSFEEAGNAYLVMDYVEGESLADRLQRLRSLSEAEALILADQLLDALAYCHSQGVIHRDIKPANIIMRRDGRSVLVDFGLVKLWAAQGSFTMSGMHGMGTPAYAPPEQYDAGRLQSGRGHTDPRSDLYSLAASLYHALTGRVPPTATQRIVDPASLLPAQMLNPAIGPRTAAVLARGLELAPDRRFQSAAEMRAGLQITSSQPMVYATGPLRGAPAQAARRGSPVWLWGLGGVVLLVLVALVAVLLSGPGGTAAPTPADPAGAALTARPDVAATAAPDRPAATAAVVTDLPSPTPVATATATRPAAPASHLAYLVKSGQNQALELWDPATNRSARPMGEATYFAWAPDGQHVAYKSWAGDVYTSDPAGAATYIGKGQEFAWAPDGREVAYLDQCVLYVARVDGSHRRQLADLTVPGGGGGGGPFYEDYVVEDILDYDSAWRSRELLWARDGSRLAVLRNMMCRTAYVTPAGQVTPCDWQTCRAGLGPHTSEVLTGATSNPDVVLRDEPAALWKWTYAGANIDGARPKPASSSAVGDAAARSRMTNWGFHNNFWGRAADGGMLRLTNTPTYKWQGNWAPDNAWLAFADLTVSEGQVSEDNGTRSFSAQESTAIWVLQPETGKLIQVSHGDAASMPIWQPIGP